MEAKLRWTLVTAIAPIAWGSTYVVTKHALPADAAVWGAAFRAAPAGLLLLLLARRLPHGAWWGRALLLGTTNVGLFFWLVYVAAQRLPSSVASVVMAGAPLVMLAMAWAIDGDRPRLQGALASVVGLGGVVLVVGGAVGAPDGWGLAASGAALLSSSVGFVLARRWNRIDPVPVVASTAWQLVAGGAALLVAAPLLEGAPPAVDVPAVAGYAYLSLVTTALAFVCWFNGLSRLGVVEVGVIGLLNPVTGVLLGTAVGGEHLGLVQALGIMVVLGAVVVANRPPRPVAPTVAPTAAEPPTRPASRPVAAAPVARRSEEDLVCAVPVTGSPRARATS
ncbi:DMT family transporter [Nocardioides zeae]|uniref:Blue pigment (Indigoidine) exporter n=1 Tax=Nocardioides zeae TaxID=1457234 RepID=A0AAJ1TYB9_9ACTN|nr:EamA family transporter [Nocardioides zeae]MDQ1104255.1 putative blue pigment (indigoidine) exporter [Nocardioides zeae]